ncbi:MAG: hypothetical protein ABW047_00970 [Nitrospiraceae bacterium]
MSEKAMEETLEDVVETIMGETLLWLDRNRRRDTSEPIQWPIFTTQNNPTHRIFLAQDRIL